MINSDQKLRIRREEQASLPECTFESRCLSFYSASFIPVDCFQNELYYEIVRSLRLTLNSGRRSLVRSLRKRLFGIRIWRPANVIVTFGTFSPRLPTLMVKRGIIQSRPQTRRSERKGSRKIHRLVLNRLLLNNNALLPETQSAYRLYHSTQTAVLRVVSDIRMASDTGLVSLLLLPDMSAAFDTVDHDILKIRLDLFSSPCMLQIFGASFVDDAFSRKSGCC